LVKISNHNHKAEPDGIIDMVLFVWRNIHLDYPAESALQNLNKLGFGWFGSTGVKKDVRVDNGKRKVLANSGVTIQDYFSKDPYRFSMS
jgi:hypothetical protein